MGGAFLTYMERVCDEGGEIWAVHVSDPKDRTVGACGKKSNQAVWLWTDGNGKDDGAVKLDRLFSLLPFCFR